MKRTRGLGFVTAVALMVGAAPAAAAPPQRHHRVSALGGSCRGSASAIAQYCEVIPGAGGGQHPGPATPTLLTTLPAAGLRQVAISPRLRPLLRIPAAAPAAALSGYGNAGSGPALAGSSPSADSASLWTPMVLVLALIAGLLGAAEIIRRRRLSARPG